MRHSESRIVLDQPADVFFESGAPAVSQFDKIGADLDLVFEDGQRFYVQDFFVIGPQGEFSRLLGQGDQPEITGLMAPEPDRPGEVRLSETSHETIDADATIVSRRDGPASEDLSVAAFDEGATTAENSDDGWANPLLLTGAGLAAGSSFFDFDMTSNTDSGNSSQEHVDNGQRADGSDASDPAALAQDIDDLTVDNENPAVLEPQLSGVTATDTVESESLPDPAAGHSVDGAPVASGGAIFLDDTSPSFIPEPVTEGDA
ncbi:hypothetical protein [Qingshengfaniella alkalisoli]|uniref:Uncharacterized protein n=1 Tax=Qingshengfaniella alkalisoli TaxID=2599296 RepID=A0A5B8J114_9RHOB|nr:hypothetical protein [Qingshengfaniella alkalisoli]QDY70568.1 hypothetical protein FPZ52_12770 [Qingshengfaniella alkalisoli]